MIKKKNIFSKSYSKKNKILFLFNPMKLNLHLEAAVNKKYNKNLL